MCPVLPCSSYMFVTLNQLSYNSYCIRIIDYPHYLDIWLLKDKLHITIISLSANFIVIIWANFGPHSLVINIVVILLLIVCVTRGNKQGGWWYHERKYNSTVPRTWMDNCGPHECNKILSCCFCCQLWWF